MNEDKNKKPTLFDAIVTLMWTWVGIAVFVRFMLWCFSIALPPKFALGCATVAIVAIVLYVWRTK